jgi:hypothetical protein
MTTFIFMLTKEAGPAVVERVISEAAYRGPAHLRRGRKSQSTPRTTKRLHYLELSRGISASVRVLRST